MRRPAVARVRPSFAPPAVPVSGTAAITLVATQRPRVVTPAHVVGQAPTTVTLVVLGSDPAGEANLTYSWSLVGASPAPVTFSSNNTNAAKTTVATFNAAGTYQFLVTLTDSANQSATSQVTVIVSPGGFTATLSV